MDGSQQAPVKEDTAEARATAAAAATTLGTQIWYCPSRWLLAHSDLKANIRTLSSHMCLADLNNDGENLLALVDFKEQLPLAADGEFATRSLAPGSRPPYACRMRVYRGQQLIYNHFLEDVPSSLIATSVNLPLVVTQAATTSSTAAKTGKLMGAARLTADSAASKKRETSDQGGGQQQPLLTLTINDDVYFYHKLRPSHKLSLEDEQCVLDSLEKSEVLAWETARKSRLEADDGAVRELLLGLAQEHGAQALTSHSNNFMALATSEARKQYLASWRLKGLSGAGQRRGRRVGASEQIMSMDTICCAAARLRPGSHLASGTPTAATTNISSSSTNRWQQKVADIQRDGLVLGTEDRHLLIYELRSVRARLEAHARLPAVPDHLLVERRAPSSFESSPKAPGDLRALTYKILISCRDRKIYSLDQPYLAGADAAGELRAKSIARGSLRELLALKSNVLEMCWTGMEEEQQQQVATSGSGTTAHTRHDGHRPTFVVACLDRRFYCFGAHSGQCKWVMETELPITCLVCLPRLTIGCAGEASLVGVASQANRFDFYVASTGRIVDSIYFQDDYPVAAKFGRFGREDNCLCLTTARGHLLVFILKRTAKFAHGQCLSSAASYASDTLATCGQQLLQKNVSQQESHTTQATGPAATKLNLGEHVQLPSGFALNKSGASKNAADKIIDSLMAAHDCDQVAAKQALDAHFARPTLQVPMKGREFVDQIVEQARQSRPNGRAFARQMLALRDKVQLALERQTGARANGAATAAAEEGNRVSLVKTTGLGCVYRVHLALRLNVGAFVARYHDLLANQTEPGDNFAGQWRLTCFLAPQNSVQNKPAQVRPFRFELPLEREPKSELGIKSVLEAPLVFKLTLVGGEQNAFEPLDGQDLTVEVKVIAHYWGPGQSKQTTVQRPLCLTTINVPLTC